MIYMFDKDEILKIESKIVDMEIDDWFSIDDNTDLNISVRDGRITLNIYEVKDGKTNTNRGITLFSINVKKAKEKLKIYDKFDQCDKCQTTIYTWDSGCQNCLEE